MDSTAGGGVYAEIREDNSMGLTLEVLAYELTYLILHHKTNSFDIGHEVGMIQLVGRQLQIRCYDWLGHGYNLSKKLKETRIVNQPIRSERPVTSLTGQKQ